MTGLITALSVLPGMNIILWDKTRKPTFDMFEEQKPDYVILTREDIQKDTILAINEFKPAVIIYGVEAPDSIKQYVKLVLVNDIVPKVIFNNIDHNKMILHKAADTFRFPPGTFDAQYETDIGYLSLSPNPKMVNVLSRDLFMYKLKILGDVSYPTPAYLGVIQPGKIASFLASTKIYLDSDTDLLLECAAHKTFVLSNVANPLFPHYNNTKELFSLLNDFLPNERARRNITKKAHKAVISEHTYLDRVMELGAALQESQWKAEAQKHKTLLV
jgi:hypothetical protein